MITFFIRINLTLNLTLIMLQILYIIFNKNMIKKERKKKDNNIRNE